MRYYSPSTTFFYDDQTHGPRQIEEALTPAQVKAKRKPRMIPNPDCKVPADAVEISDADHAALMEDQAQGMEIVALGGRPFAMLPKRTAEEEMALNRLRRDRMLAASDWTQLPDALLDAPEHKSAMAAWRQALRDMDLANGDFPPEPTR